MEFSFKLNWMDLDEELREQKIDDVIIYDYNNGNLDEDYKNESEALDDKKLRNEVERYIEVHFPIYF